MQELDSDPSAAVWNWRQAGKQPEQARSREAAAARRRGTAGLGIGLAAAAAIYFLWKPVPAYFVAAVSLVLFLIALAAPLTLHKRVTRALEVFARGVGTAVTWVLMTLLYYLLFLPAGLLLRARRRLAITRAPDPALPSYWIRTDGRSRPPESYRKQF